MACCLPRTIACEATSHAGRVHSDRVARRHPDHRHPGGDRYPGLNQREKGWIAETQSSLKQAATAIESYGTGTGGDYSAVDGADSAAANAAYTLIADEGYRQQPNVEITVATAGGGNEYCVTATHSLLGATHPWRVSTYNSSDGSPSPNNADAC
jgi:hypothetical protein